MTFRAAFALITTPLTFKCAAPVEVVPGHFIRRATDSEIDRIRAEAKIFDAPWMSFKFRFENRCVITEQTPTSKKGVNQPLDRSDWRYCVVELRDLGTFVAANEGLL